MFLIIRLLRGALIDCAVILMIVHTIYLTSILLFVVRGVSTMVPSHAIQEPNVYGILLPKKFRLTWGTH